MSHLIQVQGRVFKRVGRTGKVRYYWRNKHIDNGKLIDERLSLGSNLETAITDSIRLNAGCLNPCNGDEVQKDMALDEFVGRYIKHIRDKRKLLGWKTIRDNVVIFAKKVGDKKLRDITQEDVESFKEWRMQRVRPMTAKGTMRDVKRLLKVAMVEGHIQTNPAIGILPISARPMPIILPSEEQVGRLLGYLETHNQHLWILVLFGIATGCRLGEALAMTWDRIHFSDDCLSLPRRKVGDELKLKIVGPLKDALWSLWANSGMPKEGPVFLCENGLPFNRYSAYSRLKRIARKLGMPWLALRTFRKLAATVTVEATGDVRMASELLGHTSVTTVERFYLGRGDKARDKAVGVMSGYLDGVKGTIRGTTDVQMITLEAKTEEKR